MAADIAEAAAQNKQDVMLTRLNAAPEIASLMSDMYTNNLKDQFKMYLLKGSHIFVLQASYLQESFHHRGSGEVIALQSGNTALRRLRFLNFSRGPFTFATQISSCTCGFCVELSPK